VSIQPEEKHLDGLVVDEAPTVRISQPGIGEQRMPLSPFISPRPDFSLFTTGLLQRLVHFNEYGAKSMRVEHSLDFRAMFDHHKGEDQRIRTIGRVPDRDPSAIWIDGIGPGGRRPCSKNRAFRGGQRGSSQALASLCSRQVAHPSPAGALSRRRQFSSNRSLCVIGHS
jgi:hypothetical protein